MNNLERVLKLVQDHQIQFYLEHNDFQATDLTLSMEIEEIKEKGLLTVGEEILCFAKQSIWSARFYYGDDEMMIAYSYDAEECAKKILIEMGKMYE